MKINTDFFPLGLASDEGFCNRVAERQRIARNFLESRPTLLVSPRRYGKTSLALQAIVDSHLDFAVIDFFVATDLSMIIQSILNGVTDLTTSLMKTPERALKAAKEVFKHLQVTLDLGRLQVMVQPGSDSPQNQVMLVLDTLKQLESLIASQNKKAVLFFDEFQVLGQFKESMALEGALRHVAQQSKHLNFLFSGSQRHLLSTMFDDRNRPLYMLCDRIQLDRIAENEYIDYFNEAALVRWDKQMDTEVSEHILKATERHPYYVNALCSRLWLYSSPPDMKSVDRTWQIYALEEKSRIAYDLNQLSVNQRKMIIALAKQETRSISSQQFLRDHQLSSASSLQAADTLIERDYLYQDLQGFYRVLDPLLAYVVRLFY